MTILSAQHSSRIRNRSMGVLHLIAADESCEVSDILALIGDLANSPSSTPSQPPSQAPAARVSEPATPDTQAEVSAPQASAIPSSAPADSSGKPTRPQAKREAEASTDAGRVQDRCESTLPPQSEPQPPSTPAVQARPVDPSSRSLDGLPTSLPGADGAVDRATDTGKSGEASASPAPVKRGRTKGRGKAVEASIRGNPDWTDLMHAEHLGVGPAYIRRTAARLGLKLASRLSHRKAKQAAITKALKAAPAKPQKPVERAGPPTPRPEPKQPSEGTAPRKSIKQRVAEVHAEHPDWKLAQIAEHLGANLGTVKTAFADATAEARLAAQAAEQAETERRLIAEARERENARAEPVGQRQTLTDRVRAVHQQHPTWTATMIAKELGAKQTSVSTILGQIRGRTAQPPVEQPQFKGRRQMVEHYGEIAKRLGKPS